MVKFKGLLFSFILAFGIVASRSIPSLASAYVIDPSTIGSIGDLGLGLLGGAEFDFTGSKYQIENYDSLSQADKVDAAIGATNQFIDDYWSARKEFIKANNGFLQETYKVYDNYALKNAGLLNTDTNFHISGQLATDWMQYSKYWYKDYVSSFSASSDSPDTPSYPSEYDSYINNINSLSGSNYNYFYFYDKVYSEGSWAWLNPIDYSFYDADNNFNNGSFDNAYIITNNINIHIDTYNQTYKLTFSQGTDYNNKLSYFIWNPATNGTLYALSCNYPYAYQGSNYLRFNSGSSAAKSISIAQNNITGSISYLLDECSKHYRNCNIYVDNVLWSAVSSPNLPDRTLIPDFPDVIGTDDDPIYTFDLPDTSSFEGAFDITSLFDAIKEAIIGASDSDNTTSGVLTGESVSDIVVDDTGSLVGTKAIPISTVLDDSIEGEATKRLPNIELYPEKIHDAFSGTSLLADIILATQQSLPSAIIVVFWGIVICLIIIALIKSLHR